MLLTSETVDDVFEYVRAQTNKIDPVIGSLQRASFIDQLVESYIADIMLFLLEQLGTQRAEQFKRMHLGFKPDKTFTSPMKKRFEEEEDISWLSHANTKRNNRSTIQHSYNSEKFKDDSPFEHQLKRPQGKQ